jgi:hypothetical protein
VLDVQKKREEIKKLVANQRGKSQQIENLENEHALEAQLSNRITLHQQVFPPLLIFSCEFLAEDTITECGKFSFSNY